MKKYIVEVNNTEYEVSIREKDNKKNDNIIEKEKQSHKVNSVNQIENNIKEEKGNNNFTNKDEGFKNTKGHKIKAPMTGKVLSIRVEKGDNVEQNEVVMTLEAMKMETEIVAPVQGKIIEILTSEGSNCKQEEPLIIIEDGEN